MTIPPVANARNFVTEHAENVLRMLSEEGAADQLDRALAALTLVASAVMIAWPTSRKAPVIIAQGGTLARQVWARRAWWLPAAK